MPSLSTRAWCACILHALQGLSDVDLNAAIISDSWYQCLRSGFSGSNLGWDVERGNGWPSVAVHQKVVQCSRRHHTLQFTYMSHRSQLVCIAEDTRKWYPVFRSPLHFPRRPFSAGAPTSRGRFPEGDPRPFFCGWPECGPARGAGCRPLWLDDRPLFAEGRRCSSTIDVAFHRAFPHKKQMCAGGDGGRERGACTNALFVGFFSHAAGNNSLRFGQECGTRVSVR